MMNLQKVVVAQDDNGHWYVIPAELMEEFRGLLDIAPYHDSPESEQAETEFIDKFSKYRTNGDINNIQLYAEVK